jgi:hypothetical protein
MNVSQKTSAYETIKKIIYQILRKENLFQGEWHNGKVESVISAKLLSVYVDGSTTAQKIPCNPDVTFVIGDEIFVIHVNGDSKNKFALCRRGV